MTTLREAAQQALEALEWHYRQGHSNTIGGFRLKIDEKALRELRAALAQQAEPVAGCETEADCTSQPWCRIRGECQRKQAEPDAYGYASYLAVAIWEKYYKDTAPHWKPLDDLVGVLTQIDNMTSGLTRLAQQAEPLNLADPAVRKRLASQWGYVPAAQAEPVEPMDVGLLEYRGNSVAFIHQKMTAYRAGIDAAWDAFRANGLHPDGKTSLADMIAKHTAPPQRKPLTEEEIESCRQQGYAHAGLGAPFDFGKAARAVEKAVWEKNNGQA